MRTNENYGLLMTVEDSISGFYVIGETMTQVAAGEARNSLGGCILLVPKRLWAAIVTAK
jgi:hypothetical protein